MDETRTATQGSHGASANTIARGSGGIFGTVRYMNAAGLERKIRMSAYLQHDLSSAEALARSRRRGP